MTSKEQKIGNSDEGISRNWKANVVKNTIFKPYISPHRGPIPPPPKKKNTFQDPSAITYMGQIGSSPPKGVNSKSAPTSKWQKFALFSNV